MVTGERREMKDVGRGGESLLCSRASSAVAGERPAYFTRGQFLRYLHFSSAFPLYATSLRALVVTFQIETSHKNMNPFSAFHYQKYMK